MASVQRIGAVPRNVFNPVEAVKLYTSTNNHIVQNQSENPFKGTRTGLGLWSSWYYDYTKGNNKFGPDLTSHYSNFVSKNGYSDPVEHSLDFIC